MSAPLGDDLPARLRLALTAALRTPDMTAVAALRSALAAIGNAEAVPVPAAPPVVAGGSPHVAGANECSSADCRGRTQQYERESTPAQSANVPIGLRLVLAVHLDHKSPISKHRPRRERRGRSRARGRGRCGGRLARGRDRLGERAGRTWQRCRLDTPVRAVGDCGCREHNVVLVSVLVRPRTVLEVHAVDRGQHGGGTRL